MDLHALQNEVNRLLFLYFTSIGSIQRDAGLPDVGKSMGELVAEIARCKERIDMLLEDEGALVSLPGDFDAVIDEAREFMCDGLCFIDKIVKM